MECNTIYVVREPDGALWAAGTGWQTIDFSTPALVERAARALPGRFTPSEPFGRTWCRGWYLDLGARVARTFRCNLNGAQLAGLDHALRDPGQPLPRFSPAYLAIGAEWAGWDAGVAWEAASDLCALAGVPQLEPGYDPALDAGFDCRAAYLFTAYPVAGRFLFHWEPDANRLTYERFDATPELVLTTIDPAGSVHDYAFERGGLVAALGRGPGLIADLRAHPPCPDPGDRAAMGAVIDERSREIWLWCKEPIVPATYRELRARWPGWTVERERTALAGHLARTGGASRSDPSTELCYVERVHAAVAPPEPTAHERSLLAAIHADPDADAPRLIYADLLSTRGDERGELISLAIELAALDRELHYSPRRLQLVREVAHLEWMCARAPKLPGVREVRSARGFVAAVTVASVASLREHDVLARTPTINELEIATLDDAEWLGNVDGVARLRSLSLPDPGRALPRLAELAALSGVRRLAIAIESPPIAEDLIALLSGRHPFARLEQLALRGRGLWDDGLHRLFTEARLPALHTLELRETQAIRDHAARELAAALPALRRLELRRVELSAQATQAIALAPQLRGIVAWGQDGQRFSPELLADLPALRALTLFGYLSHHDAARLAGSPAARQLQFLSLRITDPAGIRALAHSPQLDALGELWFSIDDTDLALCHDALDELRDRFGDRLVLQQGGARVLLAMPPTAS